MAATSINCLAVVLKELGWSYTRLIAELRRHANVGTPRPAAPTAARKRQRPSARRYQWRRAGAHPAHHRRAVAQGRRHQLPA